MPLRLFRRNRNRNQEPEPVRPGSHSTARGTSGDAPFLRRDLDAARTALTRWQGYADSLALDLETRTKERDSAFRELAHTLAWLAALHPSTAVITPSPDPDGDGWQVLYLVAGGWQMSWHIHPANADLLKHVTPVDVTDPRAQWDGHGSQQLWERVRNHVRLLALEGIANAAPDGPLTPVTTDGPGPDTHPRSA